MCDRIANTYIHTYIHKHAFTKTLNLHILSPPTTSPSPCLLPLPPTHAKGVIGRPQKDKGRNPTLRINSISSTTICRLQIVSTDIQNRCYNESATLCAQHLSMVSILLEKGTNIKITSWKWDHAATDRLCNCYFGKLQTYMQ